MKDCAGTCGKAMLDDCNVCQQKSSDAKRNFKDCTGVCFGTARRNKCGKCYGGTSALNATAGMDACGVCKGSGSSCVGCDGVVNSGAVVDACGACLHPTNVRFNAGCTKVSDFVPKNSPTTGGREIEIIGAGFVAYGKALCQFRNAERTISAKEVAIGSFLHPVWFFNLYAFSPYKRHWKWNQSQYNGDMCNQA